MEQFFAILVNIVIIISLVVKLIIMIHAIFRTEYQVEKLVRASAFSSGILVYFGAKALGVSFGDLIIKAVVQYKPITFGLGAVVFPALIGILLSWYIIASLRRDANIAIRVLILIGVLSIANFTEVYIMAASIAGLELNKALVPNLVFTLSISLYAIFRYVPKVEKTGTRKA